MGVMTSCCTSYNFFHSLEIPHIFMLQHNQRATTTCHITRNSSSLSMETKERTLASDCSVSSCTKADIFEYRQQQKWHVTQFAFITNSPILRIAWEECSRILSAGVCPSPKLVRLLSNPISHSLPSSRHNALNRSLLYIFCNGPRCRASHRHKPHTRKPKERRKKNCEGKQEVDKKWSSICWLLAQRSPMGLYAGN